MNKRSSVSLIASVLALALIASPAFAQRFGRGGGWGGGAYRGGGYYNGGYGYGGYGGWGNGYYGSYGGYPYYGQGYYSNYGYPLGLGLGIALGGAGYSGYYNNGYYGNGFPYYSNSTFYGTPYATTPGAQIDINTQAGILSNYQVQNPGGGPVINANAPTVAMQSFYSGPSTTAGKADLTVKVPADAQVWLGSMQSGQTGAERHFSFPTLPQGSNMFTVRATWTENGQPVTRDKQVDMKAGTNETVDFTKAGSDRPRTDTSTVPTPAPGGAFDIKKDIPPLPPTDVPKK
jgi:uncharacterized protein (TIGR03000 family)